MNTLTFIPKVDWAEYGCLQPEVKRNFDAWVLAIHALDTAAQPGEAARFHARALGVKPKAVWNKRSLFRARGWRALVNKRAAGPTALGGKAWETNTPLTLPFLATEHLKKLFGDYKRKSRPAARAFVRQWKSWRNGDSSKRIPGFDKCPEPGVSGEYPLGWSERNLMSKCPSKFELHAERRGQNYAVGKCGPQIFTTRAKLYYMSHVQIDDVWHDNFVVYQNKLVRVLELDALDVFSGALVTWGTKPRVRREDGTQDTRIKPFVPLTLAAMLWHEGYSPRGTTIMHEHGSADIYEWTIKLLHDASDGKITCQASGITGEEQAIIGWRGEGNGNSRFKGLLEGHHALKHNELANLPAQTGLSAETRPEFTHGILRDDEDLLNVSVVLARRDPARAAQLRTRTLPYSAFVPLLNEVYSIINERDWHKLEGWDAIPGNVQTQYRVAPTSDQWLTDEDFQELPALSQDVILNAAQEDKRYLRQRRVSPADVQRRERGTLIKLPDWAIAELIAPNLEPPFAAERKVAGAYFNLIRDAEINGTDAMRFESRVTRLDGSAWRLPDDTYLCVINPFQPTCMFVFDSRKRYLGVAAREWAIDRRDAEALRRAYGRQAARLNEMTAPLIARHAADVRAETKRLKENTDILGDAQTERAAIAAEPSGAFGGG